MSKLKKVKAPRFLHETWVLFFFTLAALVRRRPCIGDGLRPRKCVVVVGRVIGFFCGGGDMVAVSGGSFSYRTLVAQLLTAPISRELGSDFWSRFLALIDQFSDHGQSSPRWMGS